jgi:hypothetical protein
LAGTTLSRLYDPPVPVVERQISNPASPVDWSAQARVMARATVDVAARLAGGLSHVVAQPVPVKAEGASPWTVARTL